MAPRLKNPTMEDRILALEVALADVRRQLDGVRVIRPKAGVRIEPCVLGNDPETCPRASTRQYQKGCHGQACFDVNGAYYAQQRDRAKAKKAAAKKAAAKPVVAPKKRVAKKAAPASRTKVKS